MGWLLAQQGYFYRALAGSIRAAKTSGSAYWGLMSISFIYGIFHAAGPGHGKAVISSYLLANQETWRRGVVLSFASALLQSFAAVALVAVAAVLIGGTAKMMGDTVRIVETVSYALIVLVGIRLLRIKGRSFAGAWRRLRSADPAVTLGEQTGECCQAAAALNHRPSAAFACRGDGENIHAAHQHDEEDSILPWGHAHGPEPEQLAGPGGWRRGLSAIIAVGLRPCSGAIIVLVFALAQGLFWAGVASTFIMGLGTAITVAAIATAAVGAKALAKRVATSRAGYGALALRGLEVAAGGAVILVGVALLTGTMASERMGMF